MYIDNSTINAQKTMKKTVDVNLSIVPHYEIYTALYIYFHVYQLRMSQ